MPKGFHTPAKIKEQEIALARTSMTQEQIAKHLSINRRTVVRIWDKAGVSRDRKHISTETIEKGIGTAPEGKK